MVIFEFWKLNSVNKMWEGKGKKNVLVGRCGSY